jgi:hypothetical protein
VAGDAGAAMEHLDGGFGGPHLDDLADQTGWYRVEVSLNFDVVIRRYAGAAPFGVLIGLGWQRHQGRTIDGLEELTAAGTELAHQAGVEVLDQDTDRDVQLGEREEAPIAQTRQNPALNDENRRLDLGLIARLAWPRRHDGGAVMGRQILVGPVDTRLVAARHRNPGLQIVADERLRHPAQEGKRIHMGTDPVRQRLAEPSLDECVIRRSHDRDEDLGGAHLAGEPVEHRHSIAGEVYEQLLAGRVGLPHGRRDPVAPFDVEVAEPAVAVAVGMMAAVFLPQQRQRYAAAAQLGMDMPPIRKRLRSRRIVAGRRK